jgi:hypothetical protein
MKWGFSLQKAMKCRKSSKSIFDNPPNKPLICSREYSSILDTFAQNSMAGNDKDK